MDTNIQRRSSCVCFKSKPLLDLSESCATEQKSCRWLKYENKWASLRRPVQRSVDKRVVKYSTSRRRRSVRELRWNLLNIKTQLLPSKKRHWKIRLGVAVAVHLRTCVKCWATKPFVQFSEVWHESSSLNQISLLSSFAAEDGSFGQHSHRVKPNLKCGFEVWSPYAWFTLWTFILLPFLAHFILDPQNSSWSWNTGLGSLYRIESTPANNPWSVSTKSAPSFVNIRRTSIARNHRVSPLALSFFLRRTDYCLRRLFCSFRSGLRPSARGPIRFRLGAFAYLGNPWRPGNVLPIIVCWFPRLFCSKGHKQVPCERKGEIVMSVFYLAVDLTFNLL